MTYTETDYSLIERHAYADGDLRTAELAAIAMDAEAAQERIDQLESIVGGIEERIIESNWRTGKKAELLELIEAIRNELSERK